MNKCSIKGRGFTSQLSSYHILTKISAQWSLERRDPLEGLGIYGRILLKWLLCKHSVMVWTEFSQLGMGDSEHDKKTSRRLTNRAATVLSIGPWLHRINRGKKPLGRLGRVGKDNIKMVLKETGCVLDSVASWSPLVGCYEHNEFSVCIKVLEFLH
jgi:hypothetical protein